MGDLGGAVGAPVEREHDAQVGVILLSERLDESLDDVRSATRDLVHNGAAAVREGAGMLETRVREGAGQIEARVRDGAGSIEETATRVADRTATYVQEQPLKSLAFAAGTGALIAILAGMATRR